MRRYFTLTGIIFFMLSCTNNEPSSNSQEPAVTASGQGESLFDADVELEDQYGKTVHWDAFKGKTTVASMIFTNCEYACPLIMQDLKKIDSALKPSVKENIQYLLVSFDVKRDFPDTLLRFYKKHGLDSRWHLLHGDDDEVRLLSNLLDIKYKKDTYGNFTHSNSIVVLNKAGEPIGRSDELGEGSDKLTPLLNNLPE